MTTTNTFRRRLKLIKDNVFCTTIAFYSKTLSSQNLIHRYSKKHILNITELSELTFDDAVDAYLILVQELTWLTMKVGNMLNSDMVEISDIADLSEFAKSYDIEVDAGVIISSLNCYELDKNVTDVVNIIYASFKDISLKLADRVHETI